MNPPSHILKEGTRIVTHSTLEDTTGLWLPQQYLDSRAPSVQGTISGVVPGYGGDVYWVRHDDGTSAVYCWTDFELEPAE